MASVRVDSGEFPLMRNVDVSRQPERSKVYTAWIKAFNYNVPDAVNHLADIIEDVYAFELWKDNYLDTPEQFFERIGILGLDLEDPAKLIKALRNGDEETLKKIKRDCAIQKSASEGKSTRQIAGEVGTSQSTVQRQLNRSNGSPRRVDKYTISQYTKPQTAAEKIRAKFGTEFAMQLKEAL